MTDIPDAPKRNRLIFVLCLVVFAAAMVGLFTYVSHVESVNDQRAELARNVCTRQDEVIDVLSYLVSTERQELVQGSAKSEPSAALRASNEKIRSLVKIIDASPC